MPLPLDSDERIQWEINNSRHDPLIAFRTWPSQTNPDRLFCRLTKRKPSPWFASHLLIVVEFPKERL